VVILTKQGKDSFPLMSKQDVAARLVARLAAMLGGTSR